MKKAIALIAPLFLFGCAQQPKPPSDADDPSFACFKEMAQDQRLDGLRNKIVISGNARAPSLEMMGDRTYPTEDQKVLIGVYQVMRDSCFDRGIAFRATYAPPQYRAFAESESTKFRVLVSRLYNSEINFGEFNKLRAEGAAEQDQIEKRRQAASDAFSRSLQNNLLIQQQIQQNNRVNRPIQTNCTRNGQFTNCTTY